MPLVFGLTLVVGEADGSAFGAAWVGDAEFAVDVVEGLADIEDVQADAQTSAGERAVGQAHKGEFGAQFGNRSDEGGGIEQAEDDGDHPGGCWVAGPVFPGEMAAGGDGEFTERAGHADDLEVASLSNRVGAAAETGGACSVIP